jgi:serine/threonine protein kinase/formylglycine-generating enzyme required for sulfatase activity
MEQSTHNLIGDDDRHWDDFDLIEPLGVGGMGVVWRARQRSLDRIVAIKIMAQGGADFLQRFEREARTLAQVDSPQVVKAFAAGEHRGRPYLVMEYISGVDLSRRLKAGPPFTPDAALQLVMQAARGLAAAAKHGIVHRDIKPANMMLTAEGTVKLTDFGLARLIGSDSLTRTGVILGTLQYISPEQARGMPCDHRSDLYSLGVVLYELLAGRVPFMADSVAGFLYQHIHANPKPLRKVARSVPRRFDTLVMRCLRKNPDDRYASLDDFIAACERVAAGQSLRRRSPLMAMLVLAALGGALWSALPREKTSVPSVAPITIAIAPESSTEPRVIPALPVVAKPPTLITARSDDPIVVSTFPDPPEQITLAEKLVAPPEVKFEPPPEVKPQVLPESKPEPPEVKPQPEIAPQPQPIAEAITPEPVEPALPRPACFSATEHDRHGVYSDLAIDAEQGITLRFRWCPPGTFSMGSPKSERGRNTDEILHEVRLTRGFWLAESECSQQLFETLGCAHNSVVKGAQLPVSKLARDDAERFLNTLNARFPDLHARLPSEAEWEYACRAGGNATFGIANALDGSLACYGSSSPVRVKSFAANAWGLYDMIGNVAEWCADTYRPYDVKNTLDPLIGGEGDGVCRGGYWKDSSDFCRAASRLRGFVHFSQTSSGMRIAVPAPDEVRSDNPDR